MFNRTKISELENWQKKKTRKPLLLQGARQVGKTSLLKQFGRENFDKVHYFNFEEDKNLSGFFKRDLKVERILSELSIYQEDEIKMSDLIIFDEIQACSQALTSLKYFCENRAEGYVAAAGSLLGIYLGESFPVGKVVFIDLYPMNFEEFLLATGKTSHHKLLSDGIRKFTISPPLHQQLFDLLLEYLIVGGMPEAVSIYANSKKPLSEVYKEIRAVQKDLIEGYENDIAKHSGKLDALNITRVWKSVASQLSVNHEGNARKFSFSNVIPGESRYRNLSNYISWLQRAGLVLQVKIVNSGEHPCEAYTKENRFKLMCHDIGVLGVMADLDPGVIRSWDFGTYKGYFCENFVARELKTLGYNLYAWNEGQSEIEFLISKGGENIPVEVKAGKVTKAKSLGVFLGKYNPDQSILLSARSLALDSSGKKKIPLYFSSWISSILDC